MLKASRAFAVGLLSGLASQVAAAPNFVPGRYESETRTMPFQARGEVSTRCLPFADADAFRQSILAQYAKAPQFKSVCALSESKPIPDGFSFAMDCGIAKTIVSFHLAKDLVSSTVETRNIARPENSSTVVTLSRRVGACLGQTPRGR